MPTSAGNTISSGPTGKTVRSSHLLPTGVAVDSKARSIWKIYLAEPVSSAAMPLATSSKCFLVEWVMAQEWEDLGAVPPEPGLALVPEGVRLEEKQKQNSRFLWNKCTVV